MRLILSYNKFKNCAQNSCFQNSGQIQSFFCKSPKSTVKMQIQGILSIKSIELNYQNIYCTPNWYPIYSCCSLVDPVFFHKEWFGNILLLLTSLVIMQFMPTPPNSSMCFPILKDGMSEYPVFKTGSSESFPMVEALSSLLILNQEVTGI